MPLLSTLPRIEPVVPPSPSCKVAGDRRAAGVGVGAGEDQRAGAGLRERAARIGKSGTEARGSVADDAAHLGREIVAADRELLRAKKKVAGAFDRPGGCSCRGEAGYVDVAPRNVPQARVAAGRGVKKRSEAGLKFLPNEDDCRCPSGAQFNERY